MSKEIKRTFDLAGLHHMAAKHLGGDDWNTFQVIRIKFQDQKRQEQVRYCKEYDTCVEAARKRLIDGAGKTDRTFTHKWFGTDKFDKSAIDRQADREVKDQHHKAMAKLETNEIQEMGDLAAASEFRRQRTEKPKRDFEKATDRRSGLDRRQAQLVRRTRTRGR